MLAHLSGSRAAQQPQFGAPGSPRLWQAGFRGSRPIAKAGSFEVEAPRLPQLSGSQPVLFVRAPGTLGWLINT